MQMNDNMSAETWKLGRFLKGGLTLLNAASYSFFIASKSFISNSRSEPVSSELDIASQNNSLSLLCFCIRLSGFNMRSLSCPGIYS